MTVVIVIVMLVALCGGIQFAIKRQHALDKVTCPTCHTVGSTRYSKSRTLVIVGGTLKTMRCFTCGYRW